MHAFVARLIVAFLLPIAARAATTAAAAAIERQQQLFPLAIIHINDFHARYEATDQNGGQCEMGANCIGGYARTVHTVRRLIEQHKENNPVYLNAGDSYQGTLWFNIGGWNVTSEFLNYLPADAMTLGNHEFDNGIEGVVPFLERLQSPMLVANIDASLEPSIDGKFNKSMVIERSGRRIGLIGAIIQTTYNMAPTGNLTFLNESQAIRAEAERLRQDGVNIIVVLSHCGYDTDQTIAASVGDLVDVIVGAHTHTFLYTGKDLPGPDTPYGDYPTIVTHASGNRVLIVQAAAYARYVGNITVYFDDDGKIVRHEGAPIYMSADVPQAEDILEAIKPWKQIVDEKGNVIIGQTDVELSRTDCSYSECNLGDFVADAMVHAFRASKIVLGIVNVGTLRVPIPKGNITYSHLVTMSPFENKLIAFDLPGERLIEMLEYSVKYINEKEQSSYIYLQVSGLKIEFDYRRPVGERVISVQTLCANCVKSGEYQPLVRNRLYRFVAPDYVVDGGDGFDMVAKYATNKTVGVTDLEALIAYTKYMTPITLQPNGRIVVTHINGTSTGGGGGGGSGASSHQAGRISGYALFAVCALLLTFPLAA